jgi:hypothetical protein
MITFFNLANYVKTFLTISFFTYLFKECHATCVEKKQIKDNNGELKKVLKTRYGLSLVYLLILTIIYFLLDIYVLITLILCVLFLSIKFLHEINPSLSDHILKKYDSQPFVKSVSFYYSKTLNLLFKIFGPMHKFIDKIKVFYQNKGIDFITDATLNNKTTYKKIENITEILKPDSFKE